MTWILTCLHEEFTLQASDRLATYINRNTGEVVRRKNETNKAVLFDNRATFANTGFAYINEVPVADWLMNELADPGDMDVSLADRLDRVASRAGAYIGNLHIPAGEKRHAFVGAGWTPTDSGRDTWVPFAHFVSNSRTEEGLWLKEARNDFAVQIEAFDGYERFALFSAGVDVEDALIDRIKARIGYCIETGEGPAAIGRIMVEAIRASKHPLVGSGVMLVCLPRVAVLRGLFEEQMILIAGWPDPEVGTFLHIAHDDTPLPLLGPNAAFSLGSQMSGFVSTGPLGETGFALGYGEKPRAAVGQMVRAHPRLGRNDPCWCGSGTKFKRCHGKQT